MRPLARLALVDDTAQLPHSAAHDVAENFTMSQRNLVAKRFQVPGYVLPKCIGNSRHLPAASPDVANKQSIDQLSRFGFSRIGQMQVDHGRLQA